MIRLRNRKKGTPMAIVSRTMTMDVKQIPALAGANRAHRRSIPRLSRDFKSKISVLQKELRDAGLVYPDFPRRGCNKVLTGYYSRLCEIARSA